MYTNGAIQLGLVLNSRAFWVWSTVLTLLLVIIWLMNAFASILGIANGKLLGLDRGWRATYYTHSAEEEKQEQGQDESQEREDGSGNEGSEGQGSNDAEWKGVNGNSGSMRQRDR